MHEENVKRQARGSAQTFIGRVMRVLGRLFGSRRMEAKGAAEEMRGRANVQTGKTAERVEGGIEEVGGTLQRKAGEVLGSDRGAIEGRAREVEGKTREVLNR
jgi:uncharacterized protein YjbJ (UPF0337 family)